MYAFVYWCEITLQYFEVDIPWILLDCGINLDWILNVLAGRTKLPHTSNKNKAGRQVTVF